MNTSTKRTSIIDMLTESSVSDELKNLKHFSEMLGEGKKLDVDYAKTNLKKVLDLCAERNTMKTGQTNKKSDLALKILDQLNSNTDYVQNFDKLISTLSASLNEDYFDRLLKLFQKTDPEHALKTVKCLIGLLRTYLHQNLKMINSMLQIIEMAFKHNDNEIKAHSYACWTCLIENFALEKEYFFKPKKFNLILMPLLNKCKTYKEENVCRAKVLAWLSFIQNIGDQIAKYETRVLVPFFNYCFGIPSSLDGLSTEDCDEAELDNKYHKFLNAKLEPTHQFQSLFQIGSELLAVVLNNGDVKSKLNSHVNPTVKYDVKKTLGKNNNLWLCLLKYYFELYLTNKSNLTGDGQLALETWTSICELLKLEDTKTIPEEQHLSQNKQQQQSNEDNYEVDSSLRRHFLANTMEFLNNANTTGKNHENKFLANLARNFLQTVKANYREFFSHEEENKSNLLKLLKKYTGLLLAPDEEDTGKYLDDLGCLLDLIESDKSLMDLFTWLNCTTKFYEHLRSNKLKTNMIIISTKNYETVNACIIFPFKNYKTLNILENDLKLTINACTNIVKAFSHLFKQNRVKISDTEQCGSMSTEVNINSWTFNLYSMLNPASQTPSDVSLINELHKYWSNSYASVTSTSSSSSSSSSQPHTHNHTHTATMTENTLKLLQLNVQLNLFLLQSIFDFDSINSQFEPPDTTTESSTLKTISIIEKMGNFSKKLDQTVHQFAQLIDYTKLLTSLFYYFIMSTQISISNRNLLSDDDDSNSNEEDPLKKESINFDYSTGTDAGGSKPANVTVENKQPIQLYTNLIEIMSILFTRVKPHEILNEFLVHFAPSVEQIAELNAISKQSAHQTVPESRESPTKSVTKHATSHYSYQAPTTVMIVFQSNRKSNDLFDTFSMQIATYVQNNLTKKYFHHQFDTALLTQLEPIFYAFLTYSTKLSLKSKTLQAWNGTFGKSTVNNLAYSKRLEKLFIELREEMINSSKQASANSSSSAAGAASGAKLNMAISLPCFKPIDLLLNQSTNATNATIVNECNDDYMMDEKENAHGKAMSDNRMDMSISREDFLSNATNKTNLANDVSLSSSSVPIAQLFNKPTSAEPASQVQHISAAKLKKFKQTCEEIEQQHQQHQQQPAAAVVNFVFSPVGRNSFINNVMKSQLSNSTSKINMGAKTPDYGKPAAVRASPRSVGQLSKRKLDLNSLIDQMPDKEFIEINSAKNDRGVANLMNKFDSANATAAEKDKVKSSPASRAGKMFKQPLTEHQKEVRRQKSFIPMEIQSVCAELDPTADSQMSCSMQDEDTNTQSSNFSTTLYDKIPNTQKAQEQVQSNPIKLVTQFSKPLIAVESNAPKMDLDESMKVEEEAPTTKQDQQPAVSLIETKTSSTTAAKPDEMVVETQAPSKFEQSNVVTLMPMSLCSTSSSSMTTIKFQSRMNPEKRIELVEVNSSNIVEPQPTVTVEPVVPQSQVTPPAVVESPMKSAEEAQPTSESVQVEAAESTGNKRRSARLKEKDLTKINNDPQSTEEPVSGADMAKSAPISSELSSLIGQVGDQLSTKVDNEPATEPEREQNPPANMKRRKIKLNKDVNILSIKKDKVGSVLKSSKQKPVNALLAKKSSIKNVNNAKIEAIRQQYRIRRMKKQKLSAEELTKPETDELLPNQVDEKKDELEEVKIEATVPAEKESDEKIEIDFDDDDDVPLSQLVAKKEPAIANLEKIVEESVPVVEKPPVPVPVSVPPKLTVVEEEKPKEVTPTIQVSGDGDAEAKPEQNNQQTGKQKQANTTDELMHRLNNTPTTSILKKRLARVSEILVGSMPSMELTAANNDTPSKRRVSFCESVQIEEIEPNSNKSVFRSTPKHQNKAKIVLSPYFSNKQAANSAVNSSPAQTSTTAASTSLIQMEQTANSTNSSSSTTTTTTTVTTTTTSTTVTSTAATAGVATAAIPSVLSSPKSSTAPMSPSVCRLGPSRLSEPIMGQQITASPAGAAAGNSPSSLIDFISNNKPSFLSQRSTIIQQQMQQQQAQKPDVCMSPQVSHLPKTTSCLSTSLNGMNNFSITESPKSLNKTISGDVCKPPTSTDCAYAKFKTSKLPLEILFDKIDTSLYLNKLGSFKFFKFKNMLTLGDLCSATQTAINTFPFKAPKYDNFLCMIKSFEEKCPDIIAKYEPNNTNTSMNASSFNTSSSTSSEMPPSSSSSSSSSSVSVSSLSKQMGSVEEEMEKLESSNCLDTSIECESLSDNQPDKYDSVQSTSKQQKQPQVENQSAEKMDVQMETVTSGEQTNAINWDSFKQMLDEKQLPGLLVDDLLKLSESIDVHMNALDNHVFNVRAKIRNLIKTKLNK